MTNHESRISSENKKRDPSLPFTSPFDGATNFTASEKTKDCFRQLLNERVSWITPDVIKKTTQPLQHTACARLNSL